LFGIIKTMLRIYIARHGQNEDNANGVLNGHRDMPLTDIGRAQAQEIANKIKEAGLRFDHIFSSPLSRALDTAKTIAATINGPEPEILGKLIERDFGSMTGIKQSKIEELCAPNIIKTETITYFLSPEGAETFPDLLARAKKLLDKLQTQFTDGNILLVTHGDFGKMIYAYYYNLMWQDVLTLFHFGNSEMLLLSHDSEAGQAHVFTILQHNS
jgi:broad specificity phosphatase PhoE